MNDRGKVRWWVVVLVVVGGLGALVPVAIHFRRTRRISIRGAVIQQDTDPRKEFPIADVDIHMAAASMPTATKTDFVGYFKLTLPKQVRTGQLITLRFRHTGYQPLDATEVVGNQLYVVRMAPIHQEVHPRPEHPPVSISNVIVRYTTEAKTVVNIDSEVTTFEVKNKANVPCLHRSPCSPNGRWKAATASASLDAGHGNVFDDARVSCIAGPCPFTKITADHFSHGGRQIGVTVLNWSSTTTFLMQAEVFRQEIGETVRDLYPVIFGQAINFTLPASAEGPSFEATMNGVRVIFPLGPKPTLSWANCDISVDKQHVKNYRCELRPGYRLESH